MDEMSELEIAKKVYDMLGTYREHATGTISYYCICFCLEEITFLHIYHALPTFYKMYSDTKNHLKVRRKFAGYWWPVTEKGVEQRKAALKKCYNF